MKELSIEEKAKRYDEVVERAKTEKEKSRNLGLLEFINENFPELKESENERIRKEIINYLRGRKSNETYGEIVIKYIRWIEWLEKQGNKDEEILILKDQIESLHAAIKAIKETHKIELEKQGEQKPAEKYNITGIGSKNAQGKLGEMIKELKPVNDVLEQNPINKIEPKFKVGDWVVNSQGTLRHIINVDKGGYQTDEGWLSHNTYEKTFHLWTIKDAKDGDVLVYNNGCVEIILLFKEWNHGVVGKGAYNYAYITSSGHYVHINDLSDCGLSAHPATKEQRDLLFRKMKEEGYEWDADKKELKKIEDEEYNGEDYGIDSLYHAQRILEKTLGKVDDYQSDDGMLEHKCAISAVKKLYEQNPWSEEDKRMIDTIIYDLERHGGKEDSCYSAEINWLKSLKNRALPQLQWKPSDEQMNTLERWLKDNQYKGDARYCYPIFESLYQDLKKLKG